MRSFILLAVLILLLQIQSVEPLPTPKSSLSLLPRAGSTTAASFETSLPQEPQILNPFSDLDHHKMSPLVSFASILADLSPHGMLPLAYGLTASPGSTGSLSALLIIATFGTLGWYSLHSMARAKAIACPDTEEDSLHSVHRALPLPASLLPITMPLLLTLGCCLFYSAFLGDIFTPLVNTVLPNVRRPTTILALSAFILLPLCLQEDLSSLQVSSFCGLIGVIYTTCFVMYRTATGSYSPGGYYHDLMLTIGKPHLLAQPLPATHPLKVSKGTLTLMNMACVAFACHYNGVKYFVELKDRSVDKFSKIMKLSFAAVYVVFLGMMFGGAWGFGGASQPLILNNYHPTADVGASFARGFTGLAILSGYPLMFAGLKTALYDLLGISNACWHPKWAASIVTLTVISIAACFVTEHELGPLLGVVGAVFGSGVIYILPAIWNIKVGEHMQLFKGEKQFNYGLGVFGLLLAVMGTYVSLQ